MANVDNPNGFRAVRNLAGGIIPNYPGTVKSNVALADGDAIIIGTTGLLDIATATSSALYGVCTKAVTATAATTKATTFVPALESIEFEGQCSGTGAVTDVGEAVDIEGTTGIMEVNENLSTAGVIQITGLANGLKNAWGANARVRFVIKKSSFTGQA